MNAGDRLHQRSISMAQSQSVYLLHSCNVGRAVPGDRNLPFAFHDARHAVDPKLFPAYVLINEVVDIMQLLEQLRNAGVDAGNELQ